MQIVKIENVETRIFLSKATPGPGGTARALLAGPPGHCWPGRKDRTCGSCQERIAWSLGRETGVKEGRTAVMQDSARIVGYQFAAERSQAEPERLRILRCSQ